MRASVALLCAGLCVGFGGLGTAADAADPTGVNTNVNAANAMTTTSAAADRSGRGRARPAPPKSGAIQRGMSPTAARSARDFIKAAVMPGGALATHPDRTYVNPYLANFAAKGLLASRAASDRAVALDYLTWYCRNSIDGYAMEYRVVAGALESVGDVDAQDSTAATFLSAYAAAVPHATAREKSALRLMRPTVRAAVERIVALQDADGLTWAKPSWHVKYLMDQVEVYWGLGDIARVSANDHALRAIAATALSRLRAGIAGLWDASVGLYAVAKHGDGTLARADRTVAFPDVAAQVWVEASDIVGKAQLRRMLAVTSGALEQLVDPSAFWIVAGNREQVGYWPLVSGVYLRAGQVARSQVCERAMDQALSAGGGAWPYHVGIAGLRLSPPIK